MTRLKLCLFAFLSVVFSLLGVVNCNIDHKPPQAADHPVKDVDENEFDLNATTPEPVPLGTEFARSFAKTRLNKFTCEALKFDYSDYNSTYDQIKALWIEYQAGICNDAVIRENCAREKNKQNGVKFVGNVENSEGEIEPTCIAHVRSDFYEAMGVCNLINKESSENFTTFIMEFTAKTLNYYCHNPKPAGNKYANFASFLYSTEDKERLDFCYTIDMVFNKSCEADSESFNDLCTDKDPFKFTHHLLKIIVDYERDRMAASNSSSKAALKAFEVKGYELSTFLNNVSVALFANPEVHIQRVMTRALKIPLSKELMTSNLLMNNFGRALRQLTFNLDYACKNNRTKNLLRELRIMCESEPRWQRKNGTICIHDFDTLIFLENAHFGIRSMFLFVVFLLTLYANFLLLASFPTISKTLLALVQLLLISNFLFIVADASNLYEAFRPFIIQNKNIDFPVDEDYDFDLFYKSTFYVNMESVRLLLEYRYSSEHETRLLWLLLLVQNFFMNMSRVYAATALLSIIGYNSYQFRKSFSTTVSIWTRLALLALLILWLIFSTKYYIQAMQDQYKGIETISKRLPNNISVDLKSMPKVAEYVMGKEETEAYLLLQGKSNLPGDYYEHDQPDIEFASDTDEAEPVATSIKRIRGLSSVKRVQRRLAQKTCVDNAPKSAGTRHHNYIMIIIYFALLATGILFFGYHKVQEIVSHFVPFLERGEMEKTMNSLFFASFICALTNAVIICFEIEMWFKTGREGDIKNDGIVWLTTRFQLIHLLMYIDPLIHAFIVIQHIKPIRNAHRLWRREVKLFKFSNFLRIVIIQIYRVFDPQLCDKSIYQRLSLRSNQSASDVMKSLFEEKASRYRVASIIDEEDLRTRLRIIQKKYSI